MKTKRLGSSDEEIATAAGIIEAGGLVAFPTETVYGLGAAALNEEAVAGLFRAKKRDPGHPISVLISDLDQVKMVAAEFPEKARKLAAAFWPGPLTIILKKSETLPGVLTGGAETVGVRMPDDEVARKLIGLTGPLAVPSANLSGRPSPTRAEDVLEDLDSRIDAVITGEASRLGVESTVYSVPENTILRVGAVTREEIEALIGDVNVEVPETYSHYKPHIPLTLVRGEERREKIEEITAAAPGHYAVLSLGDFPGEHLSLGESPGEWARNFYRCLRVLEKSGAEEILAEMPEETEETRALIDKMVQASHRVV